MAALALALLTNHILKGAGAFRTVFFLPNLLGGLALGYIWKFIFDVIFSQLLFGKDGVLPIEALTYMTQNNTKAIFALLLLTMWQWAGYMMLIYVNGLNNIPNELYEAAEIDGATAIQRFRYITLPMLMVPIFKNTIVIVAIMIVVLIAILYWFFGTELGCSIRATGCNSNMARAQGINTNFNKVLGLMISNGLVALSSALLAQYQGFADINMGRGAIVIGLAAVIIGEAIFGRIFRNFALTLLSVGFGAVIYYLVLQVVIWLGVDTDLLKMFSAIVVAIFLAIPYWKSRYFAKPVRRGGSADA